ncbi:MAG: glutamine synthetase type III, partial [Oscillibacter sp.]|nr:glutamine synthetase type III [Oscillibacter sp.]
RMVGSGDSIACANIMLNSSVAEILRRMADTLEGAENFDETLHNLIKETVSAHERIIFNGNGYDDAWIAEATEKRGLLNLRTTPEALSRLLDKKNVDMLTAHGVFTEAELRSRYEIQLENYCKSVRIEALTMLDMARKEIIPAVERYVVDLASGVAAKRAALSEIDCAREQRRIRKLSALTDTMEEATEELSSAALHLDTIRDTTEQGEEIVNGILPKMARLRAACDEAETLTPSDRWPFPTYGDLLFSV